MAVHWVESLDDPRLDPYRDLRQTNLTRWSEQFIAEGRRVVERLLASPYATDSVLVSERRAESIVPMIAEHVPVFIVPQPLAEELVGYNFHAGVLACGRRLPPFEVAETLAVCRKSQTVIACPRITNPDNLGSLIRTSAAMGVDAVLLGAGSCDPFSRRVLRVSMGAALALPIGESAELLSDLIAAREQERWQLIAAEAREGAEMLTEAQRPPRIVLVFGNEDEGLDDEWLAACDRCVAIPMSESADSLNVTVAAGIIVHHFLWNAPVLPGRERDDNSG
jgi:tRNA G18 (ribose-2'-O)-methylase SpoU